MMQTILERTGDSNWYIKHTDLNYTCERSAAWVKLIIGCNDAENVD